MSRTLIAGLAAALSLATGASAQTILTAETSSPNTAPGISIISLSESAAKAGIADIQVTSGQTLTNSVQNVAEGAKTPNFSDNGTFYPKAEKMIPHKNP